MSLFHKKPGLMDVIRCDEKNYLVWKWHPEGVPEGNGRENAIRWGSSLRVKEGEVAVFVYHQPDGSVQEHFEGPCDTILETANFPVLARIVGLAYGGGSPFQAEVYFINLAHIIQIRFGVPYFDVYDPRFTDFGVPVAVRGTISFCITDYREFIKLHRLSRFDLDDFQGQVRDAITRYVKDTVTNAPAAHNIPLVQIESKTAQITDAIEYDLKQRLKEDFGVTVSSVDIGAIELDKSSESYAQLMAVTRDVTGATIKAETEAKVKDIADKQRIESEHYEGTLRIQREEGQYAQRKAAESAYMAAYQIEKQTEVGVAGAAALGQMGANGGGNVNLGGGVNPAAMMAGMAMGGAIGKNVAGVMDGMMSGATLGAVTGAVPPPITAVAYHVAVDGKPGGPYDIATLSRMVAAGRFGTEDLVWKTGMANWEKAGVIDELKGLFGQVPPPVPPPIK